MAAHRGWHKHKQDVLAFASSGIPAGMCVVWHQLTEPPSKAHGLTDSPAIHSTQSTNRQPATSPTTTTAARTRARKNVFRGSGVAWTMLLLNPMCRNPTRQRKLHRAHQDKQNQIKSNQPHTRTRACIPSSITTTGFKNVSLGNVLAASMAQKAITFVRDDNGDEALYKGT